MARIIISTEKGYRYLKGGGKRVASKRAFKNYLKKDYRGDWERNMQGFSAWAGVKLQAALVRAQEELMELAEKQKRYSNLTGNTYVSTMSVAIMGTRFRNLMGLPGAQGRRATRKKLAGRRKGASYVVRLFDNPEETIKYKNPNIVPTSARYAIDDVRKKLNEVNFGRNAHNQVISGILLTTGTEYTSYLEKELGLNVISATKRRAGSIVRKHLLPLIKKYKQKRK